MRTAMALGRLSRRPWYSSMLLLSRYTLLISCESCWSSCPAPATAAVRPQRAAHGPLVCAHQAGENRGK